MRSARNNIDHSEVGASAIRSLRRKFVIMTMIALIITLAALDAATREGDFVFASVKGNGVQALRGRISLAIWVDAPRETRLQRVRERSFRRFGERMLPGGDLCAAEERFFAQVASRSDEEMRAWAAQLPWPVLRVDGTRPVQALVPEVCTWISETTGL